MANLYANTEDFTVAAWVTNSGDSMVTADTDAAPAFAGGGAAMASTINDNSGSVQEYLRNEQFPTTSASQDYCFSIYIKKTALNPTVVFSNFYVNWLSGSGGVHGVWFDSRDGAGAVSDIGTLVDSGIDSIDSSWWRVWFVANSGDNTDMRIVLTPAGSDTLGGADDASLTKSIVAWGYNVTPTSTLQAYEPDPPYDTPEIVLTGTAVGGITEADMVAGGKTIICTLSGSTYIPS